MRLTAPSLDRFLIYGIQINTNLLIYVPTPILLSLAYAFLKSSQAGICNPF